jgi:hypothetical protein
MLIKTQFEEAQQPGILPTRGMNQKRSNMQWDRHLEKKVRNLQQMRKSEIIFPNSRSSNQTVKTSEKQLVISEFQNKYQI